MPGPLPPRYRDDDGGTLSALLAGVASGDRKAFEALYRATSDTLFGICLRLLQDRAEAEDALQEIYAIIWHKADQFDGTGAMPWLGTIARHKALDRLRTLPMRRHQAPIEIAETVADPGASPLQDAEAATMRARLFGCLEQLDERRRVLIRTAFFDGATYEELAVRIGSPLGSVKSWIRRGLLQLRECLEQ
jgi:RNA polymerase sigma-70 factor, ECF subfamily